MKVHCNSLGEIMDVCTHFNIEVNLPEISISLPYVFELKSLNGEPLNDDNEYTFEEFKNKYLNQKP